MPEMTRAESEQRAGAADHGENRWLHGYNSSETMREWGHLHLCMLEELESFGLERPKVAAEALSTARMLLTRLFVDCMVESASSHAALERAEAASRLDELEHAHKELRALDSERTELWREAAHDLRGTVGAVKLAATALGHVTMTSSGKTATTTQLSEFVGRVRRSVESLDALLSDLIELTRLEAGRERREIAAFRRREHHRRLVRFVAAARRRTPPFSEMRYAGGAERRGRCREGEAHCAEPHPQRLKYTESGGVLVSCVAVNSGGVERWSVCVQDTGIGLERASDSSLAQVISEATRENPAVSSREPRTGGELSRAPTLPSASADTHRSGEGVGLSIVKRLCELLDASIELQTHAVAGRRFE